MHRSYCCKTSGSLEVISGYSQPPQVVKLTPHHLSLHTQAHEIQYVNNLQPSTLAGRPVAMRESRASPEDSGNQHAQNPQNKTNCPQPLKTIPKRIFVVTNDLVIKSVEVTLLELIGKYAEHKKDSIKGSCIAT